VKLVLEVEAFGIGPRADGWDGRCSVSNRSKERDSSMLQLILVGIAAGAASALLFASATSGAIISILLFYLAPLPILIAAVGWSHWAALVAAVTASAALAGVFGGYIFIASLIGIGLPAWWLGYLTLLARPASPGVMTADGLEWYPIGNLVFWAAILGGAVVAGVILSTSSEADGFRNQLRNALERMLNLTGRPDPAGSGVEARKMLLDMLVFALPLFAGMLTTMVNAINLYLAVRIAQVSGRLKRPAPELSTMRLPSYAPIVTAIAFVGCLVAGMPGVISSVFAAAMMMAYAFVGFAVLHVITRNSAARPFLIGGAYAAVIVFFWPLLLTSLLGLLDTAFDFRARAAAKSGPPQNLT
jgi:MFS family permease